MVLVEMVESVVCRALVEMVVLTDPPMTMPGALSQVDRVATEEPVVKVVEVAEVAEVRALVSTPLAREART